MSTQLKSGIVSVTRSIERICLIIKRYGPHLLNVISAAQTSGLITAAQATAMNDFLTAANAVCTLFKTVSGY